ncbi:hypothetical protein ACLOJK_003183 [Asimina triloba]
MASFLMEETEQLCVAPMQGSDCGDKGFSYGEASDLWAALRSFRGVTPDFNHSGTKVQEWIPPGCHWGVVAGSALKRTLEGYYWGREYSQENSRRILLGKGAEEALEKLGWLSKSEELLANAMHHSLRWTERLTFRSTVIANL